MTAGDVLRRLISCLLDLALLVGLVTIAAALFGIKPYVVESGSMEPAIHTGSVCLINARVPYDDIQVRDVVCFESATGKRVIHRAVAITPEGIETQGDANDHSDGITTRRDNYAGKVLFSVPRVGYVIYWIQTPRGTILFVAALIILFILAWEPAGGRKKASRRRRRRAKARAREVSAGTLPWMEDDPPPARKSKSAAHSKGTRPKASSEADGEAPAETETRSKRRAK